MLYPLLRHQKSHIKASKLVWSVLAKLIPNIQIFQYLRWQLLIFFIMRTYLIVLLNQLDLNNFLKRIGMLVVISRFLVERKLEVNFSFFYHLYLSLLTNYKVICWKLIFRQSTTVIKGRQQRMTMCLGLAGLETVQQ